VILSCRYPTYSTSRAVTETPVVMVGCLLAIANCRVNRRASDDIGRRLTPNQWVERTTAQKAILELFLGARR